MSKILKTHPKSVQAHKDLILLCLDDKDESIRLRALDLLYGMVTFSYLRSFFFEQFMKPFSFIGFQKEFDGDCKKINGTYGSS